MAKRGLILLAGTLAGILPCGTATSQTSTVLNNQVQLGDVFADQTLNVVTVDQQTSATTGATANSFEAASNGSTVDMRSNQYANGGVASNTLLNVGAYSGAATNLSTGSTGNSGHAEVTGATLTGVYSQFTSAQPISSVSHIEAPDAEGGDVTASSQAQGNTQSLAVNYGTAGVRVNQSNEAQVTSDGGGVYGVVWGTAKYDAATVGNNVSYAGASGSGAAIATSQNNTAVLGQATQFTAFGQVQDGKTTATIAGNNVSAVNNGFVLNANVQQYNSAYQRAQAETSAYNFGAVAATASGVGNTALLGDIGGEIIIDASQINDVGGIDAVASTTGQDGYDGQATAVATGNAITGYACADCNGRLTANSSQVNGADVGATATTTMNGSVRSATGIATAVGNTATYYLSKPSGQ
ncbi:MAG TPA: holdfast anchor protein HfaD [Phenylobacterium sp.]|nr:holdfast anchor protein HfaD [Phenylobacterium sp.]HQP18953.1 holdfast anchor protein HfaD [Phenylobacterium sp.]